MVRERGFLRTFEIGNPVHRKIFFNKQCCKVFRFLGGISFFRTHDKMNKDFFFGLKISRRVPDSMNYAGGNTFIAF